MRTTLGIMVMLTACSGTPTSRDEVARVTSVDAAPRQAPEQYVTRQTELQAADGAETWVRGLYRQADVRQRATSTPEYRGHALLELPDGAAVFVEPTWSDSAIRSPTEIATFEGHVVEARGTLHARCPEPPQPAAAIISPCLVDVAEVREYSPQPEFYADGSMLLPCDQFSDEGRVCVASGRTWGRYASPYCGGMLPDPAREDARQRKELEQCRCHDPDAAAREAHDCGKRM